MRRFSLFALSTILVAGMLFWWFSPGQVVKRRTQTLIRVLTLEPATSQTSRQLAAYSLNGLLASEVKLSMPEMPEINGTFERSSLESGFSWLCRNTRETHLDLKKLELKEKTSESVEVEGMLEIIVETPATKLVEGVYQVEMSWRREDDSWRLAKAIFKEARP